MKELNKVFGGRYRIMRLRKNGQIHALDAPLLFTAWAGCASLAGYAKFVKGYNVLWLVGGFVPLWTVLLFAFNKQPKQI